MRALSFIYANKRPLAHHLSALPGSVYVFDGSPRAPESTIQSMHRWWSPDFRSQLYDDLKPILDPPHLTDDDVWGPVELARVAGMGLVSSAREEIGFGVDLINMIDELHPDVASLIIDDQKGIPFAYVFREVGRRAQRTRFRLYFAIGTAGRRLRIIRIPKWIVGGGALVSRWKVAYRRARIAARPASSRRPTNVGNLRADIAVYESNPKGWEYSRPVLEELKKRGRTIVEAGPDMGLMIHARGGKAVGLKVPLPRLPRAVSPRIISRTLSDSLSNVAGQLIVTPDQIGLTAQILARRIRGYLPAMAWSAAAARLIVRILGVQATLQEGHISPAARAFLLEARHLGAHTFATHHGLFDPSAPERPFIASPDSMLEWGSLPPAFADRKTRACVVGNHLVERRMADVVATRVSKPPEDRAIVVAFGRPGRIVDPEFFASSIRLVAAASTANAANEFIVNLHPGDSQLFWEVALSSVTPPPRLIFETGEIYKLMERASVLVTNHSTAGAEALLADIPVICITSHRDPLTGVHRGTTHTPSFLSDGAAYAISTVEELSALIEGIISSDGADMLAEPRRAYASRFLSRASSGVGSVADVIEAVVS